MNRYRNHLAVLRRADYRVNTDADWIALDAELQAMIAQVTGLLTPGAGSRLHWRTAGHPRLFFTAEELSELQAARRQGPRARMWDNMMQSAHWCLLRPIRKQWIALSFRILSTPISTTVFYGIRQ